MSLQDAVAEIITVPGAMTSLSLYFCFMERESFPVGILIPNAIAKSAHASTASYKRAFSPGLLHGHIQFADKLTSSSPFSKGAQMRLVSDSAIDSRLPAAGSINALAGACPTDVATPAFPL